MINVAINGFGRIGRAFFKLAQAHKDLNVVAVNDLGDVSNFAYLLKYDSAYGRSGLEVEVDETSPALIVNGKKVRFLSEREPANLPWGEMEIDVVVESTGFFTSYEKSQAHITAGAKHVVISAPVKGESDSDAAEKISGATVLMGVNDADLNNVHITSNASCTTNAGGSVIKVLHDTVGIEKAMLNTVHAYTSTQALVDSPNKKFRRGRAAAHSIVPSSTGAAIATTQVIKDLEGKFDGIALRVPVIVGSVADITFIAKRNTTVEEINQILRDASKEEHWAGVFSVSDEELVSTDIIGQPYAAIVDLTMTRVVDGNLVKVMSWYDNEIGYTSMLVEHVVKAGRKVAKEE
jgi:glyceraldehyde 3-phosphate dehydrogenase